MKKIYRLLIKKEKETKELQKKSPRLFNDGPATTNLG